MARRVGRTFLVFNGVTIILGALLWMNGGRQHPAISERMGKFGSDAFFREFAKLMVYDPNWRSYHEQMLVAPALWALGSIAVVMLARNIGERRWAPLGFVALAMGAILWIVTYIFDGFVSPEIGKALLNTDDKTLAAAITQTFAAGQWFTIRISLYAWMLIVLGTMGISIGVLALARSYPRGALKVQTMVLGILGLVFGAWSVVAWALGSYAPGPMVSPWWLPAAIATQVWYLNLGITVILHAFLIERRPAPATPEAADAAAVPTAALAGAQ